MRLRIAAATECGQGRVSTPPYLRHISRPSHTAPASGVRSLPARLRVDAQKPTMERGGRATWPVQPRGSGRDERERARYNGALGKSDIEHVAIREWSFVESDIEGKAAMGSGE
jgi:hypothetical protein